MQETTYERIMKKLDTHKRNNITKAQIAERLVNLLVLNDFPIPERVYVIGGGVGLDWANVDTYTRSGYGESVCIVISDYWSAWVGPNKVGHASNFDKDSIQDIYKLLSKIFGGWLKTLRNFEESID
jgi:hypothetical protein